MLIIACNIVTERVWHRWAIAAIISIAIAIAIAVAADTRAGESPGVDWSRDTS